MSSTDFCEQIKHIKIQTSAGETIVELEDEVVDAIVKLYEAEVVEDNLAMLTYLMDERSEPMYMDGEFKDTGWLCTTALTAVSCNRIEGERRKLIKSLKDDAAITPKGGDKK